MPNIDHLNEVTGHDCDTAFSWWDGSRKTISAEPHEIADAIVLWAGVTRHAGLATAHILPVMGDALEAPAIARAIQDWLALERNRTGFSRQTSLKNELRSMIRIGGHDRQADADLYGELDSTRLELTSGHYTASLSLEAHDDGRMLCITASNRIDRWNIGTLAELLLSDDAQDDDVPASPTPEPAHA